MFKAMLLTALAVGLAPTGGKSMLDEPTGGKSWLGEILCLASIFVLSLIRRLCPSGVGVR